MGESKIQTFCYCHDTDSFSSLLCVMENRRRDQVYGRPDSHIELDESLQVEDLTDFEVKKSFRYVY